MWASIASFILRNRIPIIIFLVLTTAFMGYQATQVKMSYKFGGILPKDDSTQIAYDRFQREFSEDGNIVVLGVQGDEIYELENFRAWYQLGLDLKNVEGVDSIFSEAHLFKLVKDTTQQKFILENFFKKAPETQQELDSIIAEIKSYPFYRELLHNDSTRASLMMIFVNAERFNSEQRGDVVEDLHRIADEFNDNHMEVRYSGLPYIRTVTTAKVKGELGMFVGLAALVTAIILLLFFKSLKVVLVSMVVVGVGVVWSMGTIALFGYKITLLMALIPPLMIVIGIPNCVFLINKYHQEYRNHSNQMKALTRVIQKIGNATFMTNFTTAVGFSTFIFTSSAVLREFGAIAAFNIINVFFISLFIIPIAFSFFPVPNERHVSHLDRRWMDKAVGSLVSIVTGHRKIVYVVTVVVIIVGLFGITQIKTSGRIVDDLPQGDKILEDLSFFEKNFNGVMPLEVLIDVKKKGQVTTEKNLRKIEKLQSTLEAYPEISRSLSIVDAIKYARQAFYNGLPARYSLIRGNERSFISPYIQGDSEGKGSEMAQMFIDSTQTVARVTAQIADIGTDHMDTLMQGIVPKVDSIFSPQDYNITFTGTSIVFLKGTNYLVNNLITSLIFAIILIGIIMAILFTSARMVFISLIPNLIPLLCTGAIMGYFGIPLKPSTILVFSIAFGISVDDTIHFLAKYRQEILHREWDLSGSVLNAVRETGVSMIYTSIILFFGFSIFTLSNFGGTVALGLLVSITLLIAMFTNLVLLPSLLLSFQRILITRAFKSEPFVQILDEEEDIDLDNLVLHNTNPHDRSTPEKE